MVAVMTPAMARTSAGTRKGMPAFFSGSVGLSTGSTGSWEEGGSGILSLLELSLEELLSELEEEELLLGGREETGVEGCGVEATGG